MGGSKYQFRFILLLPPGVYDLVFVYQYNGLFCMKNANNLQEVWCSVDYSLYLEPYN